MEPRMSPSAAPKKARPLSPHLQIYRLPKSALISITHRATGIALSAGLPVFVLWLLALASGEKAYECFLKAAHHPIGVVMLMGWTWSFAFHLCSGIRHLIWDSVKMLDNSSVNKSNYAVLIFSTIITAGIWFKLFWVQ